MKSTRWMAGSLAVTMMASLCLAGGGGGGGDRTATPPKTDELLKAPDQPLDARIKVEKITEMDPPPLPEQVILPMPPMFAVSTQANEVPISAETWAKAQAAMKKGLAFLKSKQDAKGGWMAGQTTAPTDQPDKASPVSVAVTALALKALTQGDAASMDQDHVLAALRYIRAAKQADGSYEAGAMANYVTAAVVSGLSSAQAARLSDSQLRDEIADAVVSLKANQWDQTEGLNARQDWFGGAGYGKNGRPDLSNTQMMLDALYDAGVSPDEPAMQKALAFVSRTQNLKATNKADWAGNDGGFAYTGANGGESMASEAAGEGRQGEKLPAGQPRSLRSYASMTYAGFKSMLYAGLSPDDLRVRAAFDWIRNHWSFEENPGLGLQGLYYYYHTMARALNIAQQHEITDAQDVKHNWREEMIEALLKRQAEDGSWVNTADRWMENDPSLVTIYALLSLQEALKPVTAVAVQPK